MTQYGFYTLLEIAQAERKSKIIRATAAEGSNFIFCLMLTESRDLLLCNLQKTEEEPGYNFNLQKIQWFANDLYKGSQICFSPFGDYGLIISSNFHMFRISMRKLFPEAQYRSQTYLPAGKEETLSQVYMPPKECLWGSPSSAVWWESSDLVQFCVVATYTGRILLFNISRGLWVGECTVDDPVLKLQLLLDSALDCLFLIIQTKDRGHWRLLLEQRSCGYTWSGAGSVDPPPLSHLDTPPPPDPPAEGRSRLAGLKQMSVEKIAGIRQRLAEGRKLLRSKSECEDLSIQPKPQRIGAQVGCSSLLTVEKIGDKPFLSAIYPHSAQILHFDPHLEPTQHACHHLPFLEEGVRVSECCHLASLVLLSLTDKKTSKGRIVLSSCLPTDPKASQPKNAILQTLPLEEGEEVILVKKISTQAKADQSSPPEGAAEPSGNSPSPATSLPHAADPAANFELTDGSDSGTVAAFKITLEERIAEAKASCGGEEASFLVVTNRRICCLRWSRSPVEICLDLLTQNTKQAELLLLCFNLNKNSLLELAADLRLACADFPGAVSLYRLSGAKPLKIALKLATYGGISELLSFLQVVFSNHRNLEASQCSQPERIHLANLVVLCSYHQMLLANPLARVGCESRFLDFLTNNRYYDESLMVSQGVETRSWCLLARIVPRHGLDPLLGQSLARMLEGRNEKELKSAELLPRVVCSLSGPGALRPFLVLLHSSPLLLLAAGPALCRRLALMLPGLELADLLKLLAAIQPGRSYTAPTYYQLIGRAGPEGGDRKEHAEPAAKRSVAAVSLLHLLVTLLLEVIHRQESKLGPTSYNPALVPVIINSSDTASQISVPATSAIQTVREHRLGCGYGHVLVGRNRGLPLAWGADSHGCTGLRPTNLAAHPPGPVASFAAGIRVIQVACGRAHSLALTDCGVYSWGSNRYGQLGTMGCGEGGQRLARTSFPTRVSFSQRILSSASSGKAAADVGGGGGDDEPRVIVKVSAGQYHSLAVDATGRVYSWGWGVHGQLGHHQFNVEDVDRPTVIGHLKRFTIVEAEAGFAHSLVLTADGRVFAFGLGLFGQLGRGTTNKSSRPTPVRLPFPVRSIATGYFHNVALAVEPDGVQRLYQWGAHPQALRLEAQQRRKERLLSQKAAGKHGGVANGGPSGYCNGALGGGHNHQEEPLDLSMATGRLDVSTAEPPLDLQVAEPLIASSQSLQSLVEPASELHLSPQIVDLSGLCGERIASLSCGGQHSLLLTSQGRLATWGRSLDGQCGHGTRTATAAPQLVAALEKDFISMAACGSDFCVAVSDSGCIFGWGSNSQGQLGKPPLESSGEQQATRMVVMKTSKRIIRLQHGLQNSCDQPKPIAGLTKSGVYSDESPRLSADVPVESLQRIEAATAAWSPLEANPSLSSLHSLLHRILTSFHSVLDSGHIFTQCQAYANTQAAAKICLLQGKTLQAFDLSLQAVINEKSSVVAETLFQTFLLYQSECWGQAYPHVLQRQLFRRLVSCWRSVPLDLARLEEMLLRAANAQDKNGMSLLQSLVYILFCPIMDREDLLAKRSSESEGQLVDLFTPAFCLQLGESFLSHLREHRPDLLSTEHGTDELFAAAADPQAQLGSLVLSLLSRQQQHGNK